MSQNYKIQLPTAFGKVTEGKRVNRSTTHGSKTKFKVAVVKRRSTITGPRGGKTYGRKYLVIVDPRRTGSDPFSSPEAYELTTKQISDLGMNKGTSKASLDILEAPVNRVNFRWLSRDAVRQLRKIGTSATR